MKLKNDCCIPEDANDIVLLFVRCSTRMVIPWVVLEIINI